ncbi:MAG: DUF362 domain-containing protein [Desulfomonilaceae bacterium]
MIAENLVAFAKADNVHYPPAPFSPGERYPEYPFMDVGPQPNPVYDLVRKCLIRLGLDKDRAGTCLWNPLGELIRPGEKIVLKPNWVLHENRGSGSLNALVTHPSVVRALIDFVYIALGKEGAVVVGDAPLQSCNIGMLWESQDWLTIPRFYEAHSKFKVVLEDWRLELYHRDSKLTFRKEMRPSGDRFVLVDLGQDSLLEPVAHDYENFRVTNYDPAALQKHHRPGRHEYCVSSRILEADVVLDVAKLKAHRKAGMTGCLKNLVGINGHKSFLPHHRRGPASQGHDEYPSPNILKSVRTSIEELRDVASSRASQVLFSVLHKFPDLVLAFGDRISEGSWFGNDTLWRTILDLNRIARYADREGGIKSSPQRRIVCVVDAVTAGEGEGPLEPSDRDCGVVFAGMNPLVVDAAAARFMGLKIDEIKQLKNGLELASLSLFGGGIKEIGIQGDHLEKLERWSPNVRPFRMPSGWQEKQAVSNRAVGFASSSSKCE